MLNQLEKGSEIATEERTGVARYVARQPILNLRGRVHGYELLFRHGPEAISLGECDMGIGTMLDNAVIFGLEQFTTGRPAFISCDAEAITEKLVRVFPPAKTVLEIPASLEINSELVNACSELKLEGFQIALDDFFWSASAESLVSLADYIRVDFNRLDEVGREKLPRVNGKSISIVAKRVETQEDYQKARSAGGTLFQGNYFCDPVVLKKTKIPPNRLTHFDILRQLHRDPIDVRQVSRLIMREVALTHRLLRLVNSPLYVTRCEVCSIETAIMIIGDQALRRIASIAILSEINADQPTEILHMALVRGRFCELASRFCSLNSPEQYLLGMFSMVPAMMRIPMEELIRSLPLRDQICNALLGEKNPERALLSWLELQERAEWEACDAIRDAIGQTHERLMLCYGEAVVWAQLALSSVV
jgi:EAL and modified HD-GYP domain-containing signal transduction protein